MPRGQRYLPPGWSVEVTTRTICGFYLLPATLAFARIIVLVKAQELYPVKVHAAVACNNHYHLILTPKDEDQLGDPFAASTPRSRCAGTLRCLRSTVARASASFISPAASRITIEFSKRRA